MYHTTRLFRPQEITPLPSASRLPEFGLLSEALIRGLRFAAAAAAEADALLLPRLHRAWAELAFESVRSRVHPEAVSRLDCCFAFGNALDAFETLATSHREPGFNWRVWECEVPDGATMTLCDADFFLSEAPTNETDRRSQDWWRAAWDRLAERAEHYWGPGEQATVEALVAPSLRLVRRVHLREFLG